MLTRDRPEMAARAVRCFERRTYDPATMLILNTGSQLLLAEDVPDVYEMWKPDIAHRSIGCLRNDLNTGASVAIAGTPASDIIVHFDDDDISHPNRIAEQVALLQSSGADCVGYREMLFWETAQAQSWMYAHSHPNYCLGTSLCYWRKAWEGCKFPPTSRGEDLAFVQRVRALGVSGINGGPRMIATIHGSNTSESYDPRLMTAKEEWWRTPEWDDAVRTMMEEA